ncbi:hypothetical protein AB1I55_09930 [Enterococcus entomosocium]|uniref:Uncharacterized protein n=2 Tax=Enterococcus entomosocium TaxID=3034352 RepID=A0ABV3MDA6_9ENTE|nr:hypothetical protein [Enterococcus casseliflavus]
MKGDALYLMEDDYIVKQLKVIGEGAGAAIASVFRLDKRQVDLGEVEDEQGNVVSGNDLLETYLNSGMIHKGFLLIQAKQVKLSYFEFSVLKSYFIRYLKELSEEDKAKLAIDAKKIAYFQRKIDDFILAF